MLFRFIREGRADGDKVKSIGLGFTRLHWDPGEVGGATSLSSTKDRR